MNEIMTISNVRCFEKDGTAWLRLEDVARGLGFTQTAKSGNEVVRWERVNKYLGEFGFIPTSGDGFVPENIFYRLAMKAKNEAAEKFQALVADEIIPSIRKHGMYATENLLNNPDLAIEVFKKLKQERAEKNALAAKCEGQQQALADAQPKLEYYDKILASTGTMTTTQIAADYDLSAYELNKILHEAHFQHNVGGQWVLYREYMGKGYTKSITIPIVRSDGSPDTKLHTKWTQKGRLKIHEILTARDIKANIDKV